MGLTSQKRNADLFIHPPQVEELYQNKLSSLDQKSAKVDTLKANYQVRKGEHEKQSCGGRHKAAIQAGGRLPNI